MEYRSPTDLVLVATDGRTLLAALVTTEHYMEKGERIIVPARVIQKTRFYGSKDDAILVIENGWVGTETVSGVRTMMKPIETGHFPNWRSLTKGIGELVPGQHPACGSETLDVIISAKRIIMGQKNVFLEPWKEKTKENRNQPNFIQIDTNMIGIYMEARGDTCKSFSLPNWSLPE